MAGAGATVAVAALLAVGLPGLHACPRQAADEPRIRDLTCSDNPEGRALNRRVDITYPS
jgi:hypothetical protein